jgi:hypothetical protein
MSIAFSVSAAAAAPASRAHTASSRRYDEAVAARARKPASVLLSPSSPSKSSARKPKRGVGLSATTTETETETSAEASTSESKAKFDVFCAEQMVDEAAMLAASSFAIAPSDLIAKTKAILAANNGAENPALLASDFQFVAPVVGPLPKERFLEAFGGFKIEEGFPDAKFNYYAFRVDPFEPSRVWYDTRFVGVNSGDLVGGNLKATGKRVEAPPQACSMRFNARGECEQLTVGYVMDKQIGNTGGLGGVFGILYAIGYGLPFPEAQPWQKSVQYDLFQKVSGFSSELQKFVKGLSGGD